MMSLGRGQGPAEVTPDRGMEVTSAAITRYPPLLKKQVKPSQLDGDLPKVTVAHVMHK